MKISEQREAHAAERQDRWENVWAGLRRTAQAKKGGGPLPNLAASLAPIDEIPFMPPLPREPEVWFSVFPPDLDWVGNNAGVLMARGAPATVAFRLVLPEVAEWCTRKPLRFYTALGSGPPNVVCDENGIWWEATDADIERWRERIAADRKRHAETKTPFPRDHRPWPRPLRNPYFTWAATIHLAICYGLPPEWWQGDEPAVPLMESFAERLGIPQLIDEGYGAATMARAIWVTAAATRAEALREQDKSVKADNRDWVPPRLKEAAGQHADIREFLRATAAGENPDIPEELLQKEPDGVSQKLPPAATAASPGSTPPPPSPRRRVVIVPSFKRR